MKYLRQALILTAITFAGELIHYLLPLPVPASIYGLVILFALLKSGLLPLEQIQDVGGLLLELMPLLLYKSPRRAASPGCWPAPWPR